MWRLRFSTVPFLLALALVVSPFLSRAAIEIGPGQSLGKSSWGAEYHDEFAGWEIEDIVYTQPPDKAATERPESVMVGYRKNVPDGLFLRLDFSELSAYQLDRGNVSVTVRPAASGVYGLWRKMLRLLGQSEPPPARITPHFSPRDTPLIGRGSWTQWRSLSRSPNGLMRLSK